MGTAVLTVTTISACLCAKIWSSQTGNFLNVMGKDEIKISVQEANEGEDIWRTHRRAETQARKDENSRESKRSLQLVLMGTWDSQFPVGILCVMNRDHRATPTQVQRNLKILLPNPSYEGHRSQEPCISSLYPWGVSCLRQLLQSEYVLGSRVTRCWIGNVGGASSVSATVSCITIYN